MRKKLLLFFMSIFLLTSCGNVKEIQNLVYSGDYDHAIDLSIEKIKKKKGKKSADQYTVLLKDAYDKAVKRDLNTINKLANDRNPEKWQTIYDTYLQLDSRQEKIKPLLPLSLIKTGQKVNFAMNNYDAKILEAKQYLANHLYKKAKILLASHNKADVRKAYDMLDELDRIDPNYKDVRNLMHQAHQKGMTYALVEVINQTNKIIPKQLHDDLLNFSSYGANNFWVDYHSKPVANMVYDYKINLKFKQINISPDQSREKEIIEEKEVQDGYTYQKDANGNIVKDTLGNPIKIPRMIKVRSKLHMYQEHKEAQLQAEVEIMDNRTNQRVDDFPLQSQFVFEHNYATQHGDTRAIRQEYLQFLKEKQVPFPSNEQMIFDASKEIKMKFKDILNKAQFL